MAVRFCSCELFHMESALVWPTEVKSSDCFSSSSFFYPFKQRNRQSFCSAVETCWMSGIMSETRLLKWNTQTLCQWKYTVVIYHWLLSIAVRVCVSQDWGSLRFGLVPAFGGLEKVSCREQQINQEKRWTFLEDKTHHDLIYTQTSAHYTHTYTHTKTATGWKISQFHTLW